MTGSGYFAPTEGGDTVYTVAAAGMKFGAGALSEIGDDARAVGMSRVAMMTDANVAVTEAVKTVEQSLRTARLDVAIYDGVRCEPTSESLSEATRFCRDAGCDGIVSLGGGSVMDTAKAANLFATFPDAPLAYVNAPIGRGQPVPGALMPHIACPTTCGTGAETTGIVVFDVTEISVKTAISSARLKPTLAVIDPITTATLPAGVVASTGFDVLTHAIESYTARPFTTRSRPPTPADRPPYQGANPCADIGAMAAIRIGGTYLERAVADPNDSEARHQLLFAASLAGMAFNSASVHAPHAMSYPVSQFNHTYVAIGYDNAPPMVPHGISVVLNAPAAFRYLGPATPRRHLEAAEALGADVRGAQPEDGGDLLAETMIGLMRRTGIPSGLAALGYTDADVPRMAASAFQQKRPLGQAAKTLDESDLAAIYRSAMRYW